jgi:fido (protein-threonine AMPylation protein)
MMIDWNSVEVEKYRKINYDKWLKNTLEASETIQTEELSRISKHLSNASQNKTYKISYTDERDFQRIADKFNLMPGVVPFRMGSTLVLVAPDILNI